MEKLTLFVLIISMLCTACQDNRLDKAQPPDEKNVKMGEMMQNQFNLLNNDLAFRHDEFDRFLQEDPIAFKPFFDKMQQAKKMTEWRVEKIERMKSDLEKISVDDFDGVSKYMGVGDSLKIGNGRAALLKDDIASYRDSLLSQTFLHSPKDTSLLQFNLETKDVTNSKGKRVRWEIFYFYHLPMPAARTELTKWQNNILSSEKTVRDYLLNEYLKAKSSVH